MQRSHDYSSDGVVMRTLFALALLLLATTCLWSQDLPSGTLLPVMLDKTIESDKSKPGEQISATLKQEVPLPDGAKIKRESKVLGHVVSASAPAGGNPARITVQFDKIEIDKRPVPINVGARAFASMQIVSQARNPENSNFAPGTTSWDLNLSLIGGQIAFNGAKIVKAPDGQVVGKVPEPGAVLGVPMANPELGCAGPGANNAEQAFWAFATSACGVYDDKGVTMASGIGGATPGKITFQSPKPLTIRGGSGWLLQVN